MTAARRLHACRAGPRALLKGALSFKSPGTVQPHWITSEREQEYYLAATEWPQFHVYAQLGTGARPSIRMLDPLQAKGMPFYPSLLAALGEFVYGIPPTALWAVLHPHVLIRLPDYRARITSVTNTGDEVQIGIEEGLPGGRQGCSLRAAWRKDVLDNSWLRHDFPLDKTDSISIGVDGAPAEMQLLLAAPDGLTLDRHGWSDASTLQPAQAGSLISRVECWLSEGEHIKLEYKQELGSGTAKKSFAETVAAFANGNGGTILVGVSDSGHVVGYDPPKSVDMITNIVRNLVVESVVVDVARVEIAAKVVLVVIVHPGDPADKPYRCNGKAMIRVNATTREATTREIRRLVDELQMQTQQLGDSLYE